MTDALDEIRKLCLALPDVTEGTPWGHPVFRVGQAMFCGYEEVRGKRCLNVKLEDPHADLLRHDPRIIASRYLGRKR
jgi:predicted DNA-binding protein (MmcQ/YjbR family)